MITPERSARGTANDGGTQTRSRISFFEAIGVAFAALGANKMRTLLTMLGIIIGVAAVITMIALGSGAQQAVEDRISGLGANLLFVRPGAGHSRGVRLAAGAVENIDADDVAALRRECPSVLAVVPEATSSYQVEFENRNWNTRVTGTTPEYEWVRNAPVASGSYFTHGDDQRRARVCLLGRTVVDNLFEDLDPVGRAVRIRGLSFTVRGVLQEKGIQGWWNQDDQILIPVQTALHRVMGRDRYSSLALRVANEDLMDAATLEVETVLRRQHKLGPGEENDFTVRSMSDVASTLGEASRTFTVLLASIALVSLLVGGIGIMNIMLVSVTERTREIGVRMAMGARRRDILAQFLIESVALAVVGGLVGVAFGVALAALLSRWYDWNTLISPLSVAVSFTFALAVGVFFGLYPARKASLLDPIEALRYE
jgi:putative ABC transport system permease protein